MTASPTRRQLVFLLGSLLLAPLVTLYATQAVWLQSLWRPCPGWPRMAVQPCCFGCSSPV